MCRLFGFRSVIPSQAHRSLVNAENSLGAQSSAHPDGWGVAYYIDGAPHVTRSSDTALTSTLFQRVSGVVSSHTVLAHVRRATVGERSVLNCHPFQHGAWTFAHNGDIPEFQRCRAALEQEIDPTLRRFIMGDTDSERLFYLFLSFLGRWGPLTAPRTAAEVAEALAETVRTAREIVDGPDAPKPALLTLLVTNGMTMAAVQSGKELRWSTYKTRCSDRHDCPHFGDACEAPSLRGFVNHLIVSSEPVIDENVWSEMVDGEVIGVDSRMKLFRRVPDAPQGP